MDIKYEKEQIGLRLKEFRKSLNMSQKEFAQSLNWTHEAYRKIETGKVMITTDRLQQLFQIYHIDICYILTGEHYALPEITDYTLLNLYLCCSNEQWLKMEMRVLEYYMNLQKGK